MTKAQLRTTVKQLLGQRTSTTFNDAWYDDRVLNGYRRLVTYQGPVKGSGAAPTFRALRFPTLEDRLTRTLDTTLTSNFVSNQAGVAVVLDVYDRTNLTPLRIANDQDMRSMDNDETGVPRMWHIGSVGNVMGYFIWPRPGVTSDNINVYEIVVEEPTLASDGVEPVIPLEWHMAITWAAAAEGGTLMEWPDKVGEMEALFERHISERLSPGERAALAAKGSSRRNVRVGTR